MSYVDDITHSGFAILPEFLDSKIISVILEALALSLAKLDDSASQRAGKAFGIRNLFNIVPFTRDLANSTACKSLIEPILGPNTRVVRGIYFDKHKDANWKVSWHQDLTIAVRERVDTEGYGPIAGYGPWSLKAGIHHVQPPVSVLENMLTLRIHLDHTDESNGALRVLPGTHAHGRLSPAQISHFKRHLHPITSTLPPGGALLMRPLLLHSSTTAAV